MRGYAHRVAGSGYIVVHVGFPTRLHLAGTTSLVSSTGNLVWVVDTVVTDLAVPCF